MYPGVQTYTTLSPFRAASYADFLTEVGVSVVILAADPAYPAAAAAASDEAKTEAQVQTGEELMQASKDSLLLSMHVCMQKRCECLHF